MLYSTFYISDIYLAYCFLLQQVNVRQYAADEVADIRSPSKPWESSNAAHRSFPFRNTTGGNAVDHLTA